MKKMKVATMLIQGVVLIASVGGFYVYTQKQIKPQEVYQFSREVPVNTKLQEADLVKKYVPSDAVMLDMITDKNEAINKCVIVKGFAGQYIINEQLVKPEDIDPFTKIDLSTYRKISIPIDSKDAVGGNLKKGDNVDLTYISQSDSGNGSFTYAKTFMNDVLIYNIIDDGGRRYIDKTEGSTTIDANGKAVESGNMSTVILAVTPSQAEEINARLKTGTIKFVGRFAESEDATTSGYKIGKNGSVTVGETNPEN